MECNRKRCKIAQQCSCKCASKASVPYCSSPKKLETLDDLIELLENCLAEFWAKDSNLIENKVYEPAISGRFAMILFQMLYKYYPFFSQEKLSVDVEYNKCCKAPKTIHEKCETCKNRVCIDSSSDFIEEFNIRPDIVIHKRLTHKRNKCVFEIKRSTTKNPTILRSEKYQHDYAKLKALTCCKLDYKYTWGIHLTFFNRDTVVQIFQNDKTSYYQYDNANKKLADIK